MDSEMDVQAVTPNDIYGGMNTINLNNERLDCEHLDDLTERWLDPDRPSFVTALLRFFGNIFVDCFNSIFT